MFLAFWTLFWISAHSAVDFLRLVDLTRANRARLFSNFHFAFGSTAPLLVCSIVLFRKLFCLRGFRWTDKRGRVLSITCDFPHCSFSFLLMASSFSWNGRLRSPSGTLATHAVLSCVMRLIFMKPKLRFRAVGALALGAPSSLYAADFCLFIFRHFPAAD